MGKLWFRSKTAAVFAPILMTLLCGCDKPAGRNDVTWELAGNDILVIERFVDREGDRRHLFLASTIERVTISGHVVTVTSNGDTFEVYCLDEKQAGGLANLLKKNMADADP